MFEKIKSKISIKKLILIVAVILVVSQVITTIVVSESFLNTRRFLQSEKADDIMKAPLSSQSHLQWLEAKGESVRVDETGEVAVSVKNNSTSHSYMLLFHPFTEKPEDMANYAYHFYELGFNLVIPDYIGETTSMGISEKDSVLNWVNYISEMDSSSKIFIFGVGLGGTAVLLSTESTLPENVKGIISDSAYCDINEVFSENIDAFYGIPEFPTIYLASLYTKVTRGWSFSQIDVKSVVRNSEVPILYIHGTEDSVVPVGQSNELYEVTRAEGTDHFTIHGAEHAQALNTDSEKYWREVNEFIRNNI